MTYYLMSSSESSSFIPFLLIFAVVSCAGYLFITNFLTEGISKANPTPQVEKISSSLEALRSAQSAHITPSDTKPLPDSAKNTPATNATDDLQSQLEKQEQQRNEIMRALKGASGK